ncbi:MAG: type I restriction enzyme HsdR N-terminal domain-containing protein [Bacteroidia bacterium]
MLQLNLPPYEYKLRKKDGQLYIYDMIRRKYLVLTPEEWVRQHFVHYLVEHLQVSPSLLSVEGGITYNSLNKRTDILAYNRQMLPHLLVECKSPEVNIRDKTVSQLAMYNATVKTPLLALTNGMTHHFFEKAAGAYRPLKALPPFVKW